MKENILNLIFAFSVVIGFTLLCQFLAKKGVLKKPKEPDINWRPESKRSKIAGAIFSWSIFSLIIILGIRNLLLRH